MKNTQALYARSEGGRVCAGNEVAFCQSSRGGSHTPGLERHAEAEIRINANTSSGPSQSVAARGGPGGITILTGDTCTWTAVSNVSWITLVAVNPGGTLGVGRVNYSVLPNPDVNQRTGTITVAGQTFTLTQAGSSVTGCPATSINTGQSVNGSLAPGDCQSTLRIKDGGHPLADRYSFNATAGQSVIISATSADSDSYLYRSMLMGRSSPRTTTAVRA